MYHTAKPIALLSACAFSLAACVAPDGTPRQNTTEGALIGGVIGAIIGSGAKGNKKSNVIIGTVIGAAVGGAIGQQLDRQEEALRASIDNDQVVIVNTGSELVVTLPEAITFDTNSAEVRDSLGDDLAALAQNLNEFPDTTVDIIGHTDNIGPASFNQELSARRAESVAIILRDGGVSPSRQRAFGRGEDEPKASNLSQEGRAANRRVEIIIRPIS